jgi:hypothetical protein
LQCQGCCCFISFPGQKGSTSIGQAKYKVIYRKQPNLQGVSLAFLKDIARTVKFSDISIRRFPDTPEASFYKHTQWRCEKWACSMQ